MKIAIVANTIYNNQKIYKNRTVLVEEGILTALDAREIPDGFKILNADIVCPGFLDLQIYGAGKSLFSADLSHESLLEMETALIKQGCTGFLATLATNSDEVFFKAIAVAKTYQPKIGNFLGLHLEGPFINPEKRGAHIKEYVKKATTESIKRIISEADGMVKMITIAPELQAEEVIDLLNDAGIILSAGHSMATFQEAIAFFDKIPAATHLYNAMPTLHHREPGLVAAIFSKKPFTSIVADGIHVDFEMVKLAKSLLADHLFLITDAVTPCLNGPYQHVLNKNHYTMPDGTLSGSALSMLQAVRNCVTKASIPLDEAIRMGTNYPSTLIGGHSCDISEGASANLVLLNQDLAWQASILKGRIYEV